MRSVFVSRLMVAVALVAVVMSAGAGGTKKLKKGQITPDQLYIVDCLLPPQVRQLGQNYTYLAPRRPAKLTAKECALRGGEYVAYDEANFATVAKVWQQQAEGGDAKAQNYMGELFERGVGGQADYKSAAMWYEKAAAQGFSSAQLNLGRLYEQGLGVEQDAVKAINLYRQAAGVKEAKLELVTDQQLRERREQEHRRIQLERKVQRLKNELGEANNNYRKTQAYIEHANQELQRLQLALRKNGNDAKTKQKIAALQQEVDSLREKNARSRELASSLVSKINQDSQQVVSANGMEINVITPDVMVTRGIRSVPVPSRSAKSMSIMGSVSPVSEVVGLLLNSDDISDNLTDTGVFSAVVELAQEDDTPVRIEAVKKDGSKAVERFVVVRKILQAVKPRHLSDLFTKRFRKDLGDYYALVIGNNDYQDSSFVGLDTAVNDARTIAKVLKKNYGYKVKLLENADQVEILQALADYRKKLGKFDNLVVYYAGHGLIDERQKGYWIPVDAKMDDKKTWIANQNITDFMTGMQAKHVMVIADSCYSGTMSGSAIQPLPMDIDENDLLFTSRVKARTVLTSGGLQPVLDSGGDGHSIFASALLDVLSENDGVMEGYLLYQALQQQVRLRSKLSGIEQIPEYSAVRHAGHEGSEYYFIPKA